MAAARVVPEATVARLPRYLRALLSAAQDGVATIASDELARATGLSAAIVRKDLSLVGSQGTRGVGYPVTQLAEELSGVLGLDAGRDVVLVGAGNLGRALATHRGFQDRGLTIRAVVDADAAVVGTRVGQLVVAPVEQLPALVADHGVSIAVLAVPGEAAQQAADAVVAAGVRAVLNLAACHLEVPDGVAVRQVDVAAELQILSFYDRTDGGLAGPRRGLGAVMDAAG